ncbi:hypothetical protein KC19_12G148100, partial [Ceratodon purpureus]
SSKPHCWPRSPCLSDPDTQNVDTVEIPLLPHSYTIPGSTQFILPGYFGVDDTRHVCCIFSLQELSSALSDLRLPSSKKIMPTLFELPATLRVILATSSSIAPPRSMIHSRSLSVYLSPILVTQKSLVLQLT